QGEGQQGEGQQGEGQQGQGQQGQGQQGQGQQGQGQQGGGPGGQGDINDGGGGYSGSNYGYGGRSTPWDGDPNQIRQLRSELRERVTEAEELRQRLQTEGIDTSELDEAIRDLRALDSERAFEDSGRLPALQQAVLDRLKQFEFDLYQQLRGEEIRELFLSGSGEVPPEYRELVERYYRDLAERP
ncbi:MAG: hypothetical protein WD737_03995, partial [Gemmatimonadota bacterium]